MTSTFPPGSKAFLVINPVAGFTNSEQLKRTCEAQFHAAGWHTSFHFTQENEELAPVIEQAIADGAALVVAVGGDGTVAAVAACLTRSKVPLAIIPTGTWNAIARHLMLPPSPQRNIALMTGKHNLRKLDMMAVGSSIHAMNLGVGFSASMISGSGRAQKRKFGNLAYFKTFFKQLVGLQMQRYTIDADGVKYKGRAVEIFVANYGVVGLRPLEDRLDIHPDDGKVEILILKARTILDLPIIVWQLFVKREKRTPKYRQIFAVKNVTISTDPPSPVQADGEIVGNTPVTISVLPQCVRVVAP